MLVLARRGERLAYRGLTVLPASCCGVSHTAHIITYVGEVIDRTPAGLSTPHSFTGDLVSIVSLALFSQSDGGNQTFQWIAARYLQISNIKIAARAKQPVLHLVTIISRVCCFLEARVTEFSMGSNHGLCLYVTVSSSLRSSALALLSSQRARSACTADVSLVAS